MKRILIANRGEIAARIARTVRRMALQPIIAYSEADRDTLAVREAEEAYPLGPARASDSYLNAAKILALAKQVKADAVHPGYGFLSESGEFARQVIEAGLIWIGPTPEAMEQVSSKARAKDMAERAQVPTVPGFRGEQSVSRFVSEAARIGYPVLLKAVAGGGGRGIRKVENESELRAQFEQARAEAINAFAHGDLLLEKYVAKARHIEIQIFGDRFGNVVHLGERDCSVQRRHQKLIEETPSPALDERLRAEIAGAAVRLGQACGYQGAGTVEFLLTPEGRFYFLEVNARLQVEHTVTEMVTGLNLVEWQIRVAQGEKLPLIQEEIRFSGHAIQARLYAEDPYQGFRPQTGRVERFTFPEGARVDHFLTDRAEVSPYYDSMLAKIIVHRPTRAEAIAALVEALDHTLISGLTTNRSFLKQILTREFFTRGQTFTQTLETQDFHKAEAGETALARDFATLAAYLQWNPVHEWSNGLNRHAAFAWREAGKLQLVKVFREGEKIHVDDRVYAWAEWSPPRLRCERGEAVIHLQDSGVDVLLHGARYAFANALNLQSGGGREVDPNAVVAPMSGTLTKLSARAGDEVASGDVLAIVEAMKMQLELRAPRAGVIESVAVQAGTQVKNRQLLLRLRAKE